MCSKFSTSLISLGTFENAPSRNLTALLDRLEEIDVRMLKVETENQRVKDENQGIKEENQAIKEENQAIKEEIQSIKELRVRLNSSNSIEVLLFIVILSSKIDFLSMGGFL